MNGEHVYCCCQPGAEAALKREVEAADAGWRFAFSRPGFVTFKLPAATPIEKVSPPRLVFARAIGVSLAKVGSAETICGAAAEVWRTPAVQELVAGHGPLALQVWQRDFAVPGHNGFEPGPTPLSKEARQAIESAAPDGALRDGEPSPRGSSWCLAVALVEPNQWWIGCHRLEGRLSRWPGGVPPLELPEHAVSRAYLKMKESLLWGRLPTTRGHEWIELGCAPGGAAQALLDEGMRVIGVDPAEVDPSVEDHPLFEHVRHRATEAPRRHFMTARWLAADINAAPHYTLGAVESVVTHHTANIRGLVVTLKLPNWNLATPEKLAELLDRVRGWGYRDLRVRQLAFNRQELCVVALRSRGQRRLRR